MNRKKFLLGGVASAALMAAASAQAATITTHLKLVDNAGTELPKIGNVYQIQAGSTFDVIFGAVVSDPNMTEATRGATTASKPLGLQTLAVDIVSSSAPGTGGRVTPVVTGNGQWDDDGNGVYTDMTLDTLGPQFITTFDKNADANPDVAAAAIVNTNLSLANTAASLRRAQYGITPNVDFNKGEFRATAPGQATLRTIATAANLFMDPVGGGNELAAQSALSSVVNGEVTINVIPGQTEGKSEVLLAGAAGPGTVIPLVITGGNGNYVSNTATVVPPAVQGTSNLSAIGQEGPVLVMIQFTDTVPGTGPALDDAFLNAISLGEGNSRVLPGSPTFTQLAAHYPILNQAGAALFMLDDPGRFLNFDFTEQGGIAVAAIAAVPEPGIIGALALGGLGLLARRRRNA